MSCRWSCWARWRSCAPQGVTLPPHPSLPPSLFFPSVLVRAPHHTSSLATDYLLHPGPGVPEVTHPGEASGTPPPRFWELRSYSEGSGQGWVLSPSREYRLGPRAHCIAYFIPFCGGRH